MAKPGAVTGLTVAQVRTIGALTRHRVCPHPALPWGLPLPVSVLLVLIHVRTNVTTRALAALLGTSQSAADPIIHQLVPVPASALPPAPDNSNHPWIIDATPIPVHDQPITAISRNFRRSINTQIITCARRRHLVIVDRCRPGNRNDVIVASATVAHLLTGHQQILGDRGDRSITSIITPRRDYCGPIIRETYPEHHRIRARTEHVIAQLTDWQILGGCRRRGDATTHSLQIIAGLWNPKTRKQLRVNA